MVLLSSMTTVKHANSHKNLVSYDTKMQVNGAQKFYVAKPKDIDLSAESTQKVSEIGDINGDGYPGIIIGAKYSRAVYDWQFLDGFYEDMLY